MGSALADSHRLLESAEQVDIVGFLPEVVRDRLDSLLQGELEARRIDRDADAAALFQEPVDDGRVEALSRNGTAQLRVERDLRGGEQGIGKGDAQARKETHHGGVLLVDLQVAPFRLGEGLVEDHVQNLPLLVPEQKFQRIGFQPEMLVHGPDHLREVGGLEDVADLPGEGLVRLLVPEVADPSADVVIPQVQEAERHERRFPRDLRR